MSSGNGKSIIHLPPGHDAGGRGEGKYGSTHNDSEAQMEFIVAVCVDGPPRVLLDFRRMVDHLLLDPHEANAMGQALIDSAKEAKL